VAATTPDDTEHGDKEPEPSFLASFNRADAKLFLVTFAGTVAANVITVMVVAVAVILARPQLAGRPTVGLVLVYLFLGGFGVLLTSVSIVRLRRKRVISKMFILILMVFSAILVSEDLLILLGFAVRVK
jgi:hypothetical protein